MLRKKPGKKGFTLVEIIFVVAIFTVAIASALMAWTFFAGSWAKQDRLGVMRSDVLRALETIKHDLRLSSLTEIVFYPASGEPYTAISIPQAVPDSNGFFPLDASERIDWDRTVVYHLYNEADGTRTLRRTVLFDRDNTLTKDDRYEELEGVVAAGSGHGNFETDDDFVSNVEKFEMSNLSSIIDFYGPSTEAVRAGKVVFGMTRMAPGNHVFRFESTGKNEDSSGYGFGIDQIMIEPSGGSREAEYYLSSFAPSGAFAAGGGAAAQRAYGSVWSNKNYLDVKADVPGGYCEMTDGYDLARESVFLGASLDLVICFGDELRVGLNVPDTDLEYGTYAWDASAQVGTTNENGETADVPGGEGPPVTIRNIVEDYNIDRSGDLVRVCFKARESSYNRIKRAYITKRDGNTASGLANLAWVSGEAEDFHRHQQLFFRTSTGAVSESVVIPENGEAWSLWTAFPLRMGSDYLISVELDSDVSNQYCRCWEGSGAVHSYYLTGAAYSTAGGLLDWSSLAPSSSSNIYISSKIDTMSDRGTLESVIYDTAVEGPSYTQVRWSESVPPGSDVTVKVRTSDDPDMVGASDWSAVSGVSSTPAGLSAPAARYFQFQAELEASPFWISGTSTMEYPDYVNTQAAYLSDDAFPSSGGVPYITGIYSAWADDIEIGWSVPEKLVTVTGYIARRSDYGQVKLLVDGQELIKVLSVKLGVSTEVEGGKITHEDNICIYPRNTGK